MRINEHFYQFFSIVFIPQKSQYSNRGTIHWTNEWMSKMEIKSLAGGLLLMLRKAKKFVWAEKFLHTSHVFVFRLCFTLNYGFIYRDRHMCEHIQTFVHDERWTFPFSPPPLPHSRTNVETRLSFSCRMCESVFKNISTWIHHKIFIFNFSCNAHTPKI